MRLQVGKGQNESRSKRTKTSCIGRGLKAGNKKKFPRKLFNTYSNPIDLKEQRGFQ